MAGLQNVVIPDHLTCRPVFQLATGSACLRQIIKIEFIDHSIRLDVTLMSLIAQAVSPEVAVSDYQVVAELGIRLCSVSLCKYSIFVIVNLQTIERHVIRL